MNDLLTPYQLLLRTRLSARYHQQRRRVLLRRARCASYLSVATSLGVVASLVGEWPQPLQLALPLLIGLLALADTLFGFTAQAYEHQTLYRRWMELEEWMAEANLDDTAERQAAMRRILRLEADEPPVNGAAVDACDNELLQAEGHEPAHKLGCWRRLAAAI